jgi:putative SOS response-associated peptidase YedK
MCGRVRLSSDVSEIRLVFSIPAHRPTPNFPPSWNVAPTDPFPVVRYDAKAGERSLDVLRWGLVPFWAKDIKVGFANINAKAEGIENKPAARRSSGAVASCRSITFTIGRRRLRANSPTPSRWLIGG